MQPQQAPEDALLGSVLADKYRVLRQIGRGGMGVVYEGEHLGLGKRVAIKLMLEKYAQDGEATARFHREAVAASRIGNPHIIDVSDVGTAPDGRSFVVMELLNGLPLAKLIEMSGALPPWRAVAIMRQVLRAVGAAHAKGIIHRDLKPDNIFIVNGGDQQHDFVKLLDFGISKMIDPDEQVAFTKLTTTGVVMGTPLYMAPEQAMGHPIERHADIYACGVILFEMLAGKPPFEGATYAHLVAKLITQPPPLLSDLRPGLPGALVAAVHRALEKEPRDRFQSCDQFMLALPGDKTPSMIELAGTLDSSSGAVAVSPPTTQKRVIKRRWPLVAMLGAAVAGAGVFTLIAMQQKDEPAPAASAAREAIVEPRPAGRPEPAMPHVAPIASGTLQIKTQPAGALVAIDGKDKGVTPIEITLAPGKYKVTVSLEGHETLTVEEEVREKERASVMLPLQLKKPDVATKDKKPAKRGDTKAVVKTPEVPVKATPYGTTTPTQPPTTTPPTTTSNPTPVKKAGTKPNPY